MFGGFGSSKGVGLAGEAGAGGKFGPVMVLQALPRANHCQLQKASFFLPVVFLLVLSAGFQEFSRAELPLQE